MNALVDPWAGDPRPPRRWQVEAYPLAMAAIRSRERGVIHACTGAGKTRLQVAILRTVAATLRDGWRVVVTVPKQALVEQTTLDVRRAGLRAMPFYARGKRIDAPVVVACQDSLERLCDRLDAAGYRVALWMADECHRANPPAFRALVEERLRPATRIGLTATPFTRCDDEALVGWDRIVYGYRIDDAIRDGVLVPWRSIAWDGDEETDATTATIAMIRAHAPDGPGIVSARDIADARECAEALTAAGIPAASISSADTKAEREVLLSRLELGELRCLVHVDLLTEGVDLPWLRWLAMRRPRSSAVAIVQEVGRVLRTCPGKTEAVVLLPHLTPVLSSIAREAALSPVEVARRLREAAEREVDGDRVETDPVQALAVSVGDVDGWAVRLRLALVARGARIPEPAGGIRRAHAPTVDAVRRLAAAEKAIRYLPAGHREAARGALAHPEVLSQGAVDDLCAVLGWARQQAGAHYAKHAHEPESRRFWRGVEDGADLPEPPRWPKVKR